MANYFWLIAIIGGTIALGVAIAIGAQQRRLRPPEKRAQDERVEKLYDKK